VEALRKVQPPRFWVLLFDSLPQFLFGTMFFLFLFGDRLVLWISSTARASGYSSSYQIGVDSALLMVVPISATQLPLFLRLSERLDDLALRTGCADRAGFARGVGRSYSGLLTRVLIPASAICAVAFLLSDQIIGAVGGDSTSVTVFETAIVGMFMFSMFLSNAALLAMFRRTALTGALLLVAAIMNIVLTAAFMTLITPAAAVLGFVLSSLFLALGSLIAVARMSRHADHAYYAAV
jgi:O-antigen/teichoic acid export membrane protein